MLLNCIYVVDKDKAGEAVDDDAFKDFAFAKGGLEDAKGGVEEETGAVAQSTPEPPENEK